VSKGIWEKPGIKTIVCRPVVESLPETFVRIHIKPLSINRAFQGRRFKTKEYLAFETSVKSVLPKINMPQPPFKVSYIFGFSSILADLDNPTKLITDILQAHYKFNDKDIYEMHIQKVLTKKRAEFFSFDIKHLYE
jgi:Holliday junction resolvase RusA-like endonuclease